MSNSARRQAGLPRRDSFSPAAKAERDYIVSRIPDKRLMGQGLQGRTPQKVPVCPAEMFGTHPDKSVRAIAIEQARDAHILNDIIAHGCIHAGKCGGKACKAQRSGVSVQYQGKVAVKWRQQVGRNVLGGGAF